MHSESKLELGYFRAKLSVKACGGYVKRRISTVNSIHVIAVRLAVFQCICYIASYSNQFSSSAADTLRVLSSIDDCSSPQTFTLIAESRKLNAHQGDKEDD